MRKGDKSGNERGVACKFLHACQNGDLSRVETLTTKYDIRNWTSFRYDISGDTALHVAARGGHLPMVKFLCENWNEPTFRADVTNKDMKRPLHEAAQFAHDDVVEYLITQGVSVDSLKRGDWTPLMLACTKTGSAACKCIITLLKAEANPTIRNKDGWTPLLIVCRAGNKNAFEILLKWSPQSVNAKSNNGRTAMHIAAFHGNQDILNLLAELDMSLLNTKDSSGSTPLHEAVKGGSFETVKQLVDLGADVKAVDNVNQTILHVSALTGDTETIEYILQNKLIEINVEAMFGVTPLIAAQRSKQERAIKIIKEYVEQKDVK